MIEHKKLASTRGPRPRYLTVLERAVLDAAIEKELARRSMIGSASAECTSAACEAIGRLLQADATFGNAVERLIEEREKQ